MIKRFSPKQLRALSWWHRQSPDCTCDAIICDGAVRSGKTFCLSLSFVLWSLAATSACAAKPSVRCGAIW